MRRAALLLLTLVGFSALSASAQDLKALESQLKAEYEGKLVRLNYPAKVGGFRVELPKSERKSLQAEGHAYVQVEDVKLKKDRLELRSRRAGFYVDSQNKQHIVVGRVQTYRLRWENRKLGQTQLREALAVVFPVRDTVDPEWVAQWVAPRRNTQQRSRTKRKPVPR